MRQASFGNVTALVKKNIMFFQIFISRPVRRPRACRVCRVADAGDTGPDEDTGPRTSPATGAAEPPR